MFDVQPVTTGADTACGPTCLKMMLDYYGTELPLSQLIEECNMRIIGTTLGDLTRVGREHGLDPHSYNMDCEELVQQDRPAIILWKHQHFVVFCGFNDSGYIVICNPSRGRYGVDPGSFKTFYSGVAMFNGVPHDLD